ncbi:uncharacterized protein [Drosophila kikkawai]|uniref:Uncharacterized protein n=1 Tax=Drosophila kikkawai TaxID=30033 RepID=A0A6P4IJE8_DROKI
MESKELDFLFNVVITHAKLFKDVQEPDKIDAVVKFARKSMTIPNNVINASDFDVNCQFPFSLSPNDLREDLANKGVVVSLRYNKSSLGTADVFLPDTFLDKIGPTMNDLFHEETLPLMRQKNIIGNLSVLFVLTIKCGEKELDQLERKSSRRSTRKSGTSIKSEADVLQLAEQKKIEEKEECFGMGPTINPQDVLFVMGDPDPLLQIPSEPCSELPTEEGDERLRLDLQRYPSLNRRVIFPDDDPKQKPSLSQLKKLTEKYARIIDSVTEKLKRVTKESPFKKETTTPRTPPEVGVEHFIPVPIESEEEYGVKPIRFCPVCLYPMSWLPRYTPCPSCNTRPRPVQKAEKQMTANEIVAEQLVRPKAPRVVEEFCKTPCEDKCQPMVNFDSDTECPPGRCTCKDGNFCTHCRIRKLCQDIFDEDEVKKQAQKLGRYPQPRSTEDFALIPDPEDDDRPYLARVFSEMKNLYAQHDSRKIDAIRKRCQFETLRSAPSGHDKEPCNRQRAGHKQCLPAEPLVPRRHGWDWPRSPQARKYGWRPGCIMRAAVQVMRYFLTSKDERTSCCQTLVEHEQLQRQNTPVLNIWKRDGEIFVTLRPLGSLGKKQKPITFRIVKSHLAVALRQIKRALKDQGFEKCACHKSLMLCTCRDALEKFELNKALRRECQRRLIEPCPEHLVLTDTSVSDLEFNLDVHPPSRRCRSQIKAIQNSVNYGTQTSKKDVMPPPKKYPTQMSPYYRGFDCALGDRYMGTALGWPGEQVFEDGVFGLAGGGPHGPKPMPCGRASGRGAADGAGEGPYAAFGGVGGGGGMLAGRKGKRGACGGGPGGAMGGAWKGFPVKEGRVGYSEPIPVRYPKRFLKPAQDAAKAAKQAEIDALEKKKKGIDMVKYLQQKGTLRRPWNPIDGKDTRPILTKRTKKESFSL